MSLEYVIAVLRARWLVATITLVAVFGSVAAYTWMMPRKYIATSSVVLDIKNPDPIAGQAQAAVGSPTYMLTQIEVITSTRVAEKAARILKLDQVPELRNKWQQSTGGIGSFEAWVANVIKAGLEARPLRGSNVITFLYTAEDPKFASAAANAFMQAYLVTSVELRTNPAKQFNEEFDEKAKQLREKYEASQRRLSEFQQQQGLVVTDERMDIETNRLNALSNDYLQMQSAMADSNSRQSAARSSPDQSPDVISNATVAGIRGDIIRQEASLEQLSSRLGDNHPQVVELKTSLAELRRKLDVESRRIVGSVSVANNVTSARLGLMKAALDEQRTKVLKLKSIRDEASLLQRDVEVAQRALEAVTVRMQNATLESQAPQANVAPLEYATPPGNASSPRIGSNLALGMALGLVLAVALAFFIELFDRRMRTATDVEALLDLHSMGSLPRFKTSRADAGRLSNRFQLGKPALNAPAAP
ncbi:MAG: chain length determinant protein EpsF [Proteobacteria bacterium]|uniref:chain length determinant protein EpsF n=1 Tax=Aquabacterium sp. TaxID=1872578 RepID=UPI0035C74B1E|nr:chain length determinant protein EpsF [Pseudomonadota bacterium]